MIVNDGYLNPISDNFVANDKVFLRELQNFFFKVLGMMSITHYGAIGDGRTDCYGPLQVAIEDAHARGLSYLYVPYGRYIYTGELQHLDGITFIGNPHAKIINIRTGEEITIEQFGWDYSKIYSKSEVYNKEEIDFLLQTKQNVSDMSSYYTKEETDDLLETKQNTLIAGEGITIDNDVISATGSISGTLFSSCPFPTVWGGTTEQQSDTGSNDYGSFTITTNAVLVPDSGTKISYAFDQDIETYCSARIGAAEGTENREFEIELPNDVSIRPVQFYFYIDSSIETRISNIAKVPLIYGYNESTSEYEFLGRLLRDADGQKEYTVDVDATKYYTKFKLANLNGTTNNAKKIYDIQVKVGYIKSEE